MVKITKFFMCGLLAIMLAMPSMADARGGSSGGGGGRGGSSSAAGRSSAPSGGYSAPRSTTTTTAAPSAPRTTTTTTTTTTTSRNYSYSSRYVSPGGYYGGWGMGYSYTNGLLTGMIIGGMLHPHGTILYTGPGIYANNAVLYPNGNVVNRQGYVIGTYVNGVFVPVENGAMVAQSVPADAGAVQPQVVQPVVVQQTSNTMQIMYGIAGFLILLIIFVIFVRIL